MTAGIAPLAIKYTRRCRFLTAALVLVLVTGCGTNGDFGRTRTSLQSDDMHAWLGPAAAPPAINPPWRHQLTDEERRLRDYAFPLIEPPYERNKWYSVVAEYGLKSRPWPYPDRATYASKLFQTAYRSQTGRYSKLIEDMRNDVLRLEPFFNSARIVADMDQRRAKSLAHISALSAEENINTVNRMRENEAIVLWVREAVQERIESYKIALERMVIAAPSPMAVDAERALTLLQQRAGLS